jgi:hypothetical protein
MYNEDGKHCRKHFEVFADRRAAFIFASQAFDLVDEYLW